MYSEMQIINLECVELRWPQVFCPVGVKSLPEVPPRYACGIVVLDPRKIAEIDAARDPEVKRGWLWAPEGILRTAAKLKDIPQVSWRADEGEEEGFVDKLYVALPAAGQKADVRVGIWHRKNPFSGDLEACALLMKVALPWRRAGGRKVLDTGWGW